MMLHLLYHRRWIDDDYYDTKLIGIYSSYEKASNTISKYLSLPGFSAFPTGFHIDSFDVSTQGKHIGIGKENTVYLLTGVCLVDIDEITVSFGIYPNKITAILASIIKSIQKDKRIGEKFYIDRCVIDEDDWKEGFVILP